MCYYKLAAVFRQNCKWLKNFEYTSYGSFHFPPMVYRQNDNQMNSFKARAQNLDQVHFRKMGTVSYGCYLETGWEMFIVGK